MASATTRAMSSAAGSVFDALSKLGLGTQWGIAASELETIQKLTSLTRQQVFQALVEVAQARSTPEISGFKVGAVVESNTGHAFLGVNREFPGLPISTAIHAEQSAVYNAWNQGAEVLKRIFISAAPCGHCRQFMNECLYSPDDLDVCIAGQTQKLSSLLKDSFGPSDLGCKDHAFVRHRTALRRESHVRFFGSPPQQGLPSTLLDAAVDAAEQSYSPFTHAQSGVAFLLKSNQIVKGSYIENAAFNPALAPVQAAVISLESANATLDDIRAVAFAERKDKLLVSHAGLVGMFKDTFFKDVPVAHVHCFV